MQRLIVVYNPRSSKCKRIEEEVIRPAQKAGGYAVGKFEVKQAPVEENAAELAKILLDGDLVLVAGGDGSATMGLNAAMQTKADVTLAVLGYGNFNDFARMMGTENLTQILTSFESGNTQRLFPLEAVIDGESWRYAACYFTIGMFAESTEVFNDKSARGALQTGKKGLVWSILNLAKWYFSNKRKSFLAQDIQMDDVPMNHMKTAPSGRVNKAKGKQVSDVLFVNGKTVGKIMRGGDFWQSPEEFLVAYGRLKGIFRLVGFMAKSVLGGGLPGKVHKNQVKIDFSGPTEFEIQAEGEYAKISAKELVVRKAERSVKVVTA